DDYSDSDLEQLQTTFNETVEENITVEDVELYYDEVSSSTHGKIGNIMILIASSLMVVGGIFLFQGYRSGVRYGAGGSGLYIITFSWGALVSYHASTHLPKPIAWTLIIWPSGLFAFCGLCCLWAAFLPLMFASGRAALSMQTLMETMDFEEE
ncbi:MAG: hypothetical protein VX320_06435, partial [Candidatus Thermoplasmatota archaeon]|nr:hypothetical protein [Candidatus Thermoplasmatota archaeon]MEE3083703.1 hypothetical protein [Candidatus Thermoplasmatota archaeon]